MNNILMPALVIIFLYYLFMLYNLMVFYKAVEFMFYPNMEKFHSSSIIVAVGHAFFTLSLGMTTILTYAASLDKKQTSLNLQFLLLLLIQ